MTLRFFFATTASVGLATLLAASCVDNSDCTRTATCPSDGGGGAGAGSVGGTTSAGGDSSTGGGDGSKQLGETCASPSECESTFCVDGVCCDGACDGICSTCNGADVGVCGATEAGQDPDDECGAGTCDGLGSCLHGEVNWALELGDSGDNALGALTFDSAGATYLLGDLQGATDDSLDIRKLAAGGSVAYATSIQSSISVLSRAAATNAADGLVFGGYFTGDADFGEGPVTGTSNDPFVGLLDASGQPDWGTVFPSDSGFFGGEAYTVALAPNGDIYAGGNVNGTTSFGGQNLGGGLFLTRLSSTGTVESATGFTLSGTGRVNSVAVTLTSEVAFCGHFTGTLSLGGPNLVAGAGGGDLFLAKLDSSGNHQWSKTFGTAPSGGVGFSRSHLAIDATGQIAVAAPFTGTVNLGGDDLSSGATTGAVLGFFDENGNHLWSRGLTATTLLLTTSVAIDSAGDIVVAGRAQGAVDFGAGTQTPTGTSVPFVAKYTPDGTLRWSVLMDADVVAEVRMVVDSNDNIVVAGEFTGPITLGPNTFNATGTDVFVVSLTP